ncbi:MAG: hypothetical protein KH452_02495 [Clostridiales bacterium]|nr:hypothetical protein [Clostridiales bacterium]
MAGRQYQPKNVTARVYSIVNGVKEIQHVRLIRIKSRKYNLLIMEDYMPVLGEIDGDVTIQSEDEIFTLEGIYGFYMHQDNQFRLMLKEKREEI